MAAEVMSTIEEYSVCGRKAHGATRQLAEKAAGLSFDQLPDAVVTRARFAFLDAFACGAAGTVIAGNTLRELRDWAAEYSTPSKFRGAQLYDGSGSHPPSIAAFVNGAMGHTIDFDDTHMASITHLGASLTATTLALAQSRGASGAAVLTAMVAGYEVAGRVGRAALPGHYMRWHSTSSIGAMACAAAAGNLLGLDAEGIDIAISYAADDAGGTQYGPKVGDFTKSMHAGVAAQKGIQAATLAQASLVGPTGLLEHPRGFFWAYTDEGNAGRLDAVLAADDPEWESLEIDFKAYPAILTSHTFIEAITRLVVEHNLTADDINAIDIWHPLFSTNHGLNYAPETELAARLSLPLCAAAAAVKRGFTLDTFANNGFREPVINALAQRVSCHVDDSYNTRYPNVTASRVVVETTKGATHELEIIYPLGSHHRPMGQEQHIAKIRSLLRYAYDDQRADSLIERGLRLERVRDFGDWFKDDGQPDRG